METSLESVDLHEFKTQMCLMLASYKQLNASSQSAAKKLLISKLDILPADHKLKCIEINRPSQNHHHQLITSF